jgi:hypothetical protein
MAFKTPGVYIEEIASFPPSVVAVETAVPAFVGYTEKATDTDGSSLSFAPKKIKSLLDFETFFGKDFVPTSYRVTLDIAADNTVSTIDPRDAADNSRRYYLYSCIKSFYQNGGGACYIVSVGNYTDAPAYGDTTTPLGLVGGLSRLERFDEPTLILFPDGVSLSDVELGTLQADALTQCANLQDRFVIMDLRGGDQEASLSYNPIADFRQRVGTGNLKYGAAYYPWLKTIYRPSLQFSQLAFFSPVPAAIPDGTIDTLTGDATLDGLTTTARAANAVANTIVSAVDAVLPVTHPLALTRANFNALSAHYSTLLDVLRQTPNTPLEPVRTAFGNLVFLPRAIALAFETISAAGFTGELGQVVNSLSSDTTLVNAIIGLISLEKNAQVRPAIDTTRTVGDVEGDYASLDGTPWIAPNADSVAIATNPDTFGANTYERALGAGAVLEGIMNTLAAGMLSLFESAEFLAFESEKALFASHPVFLAAKEQIERAMAIVPTGGAVAGVYAAVDRSRGVWKAPANVSLSGVSGPTVKINDEGQSDLNVHTTGKSINAIRAFTGKGTLIWGARTLDGNSNEWRYVPVRRFFNMAEESVKKATVPFTFEPNDANTWIRVRAMIENFLTLQWRAGALAGEKTNQAFYVKVGLGETMTAQDILEGRMIVEIGMAVVRPAEFIVLKFAHKMQES